MDSLGPLTAKSLCIDRQVSRDAAFPNVLTFRPTITGFNTPSNNVIAFVDLAQQSFSHQCQADLDSQWWLSFNSYSSQLTSILSPFINTSSSSSNGNITSLILTFLSGADYKLSSDDHIAELFVHDHHSTDSLLILHTPPSKSDDFFMPLSADNPYANLAPSTSSENSQNGNKTDKSSSVKFLLTHPETAKLTNWLSIPFPPLESPTSTSRERTGTVCNDMLKHWECRLSHDKRFLLVFPQKLGEIADVYLSKQGMLYWIQSLCGLQSAQDSDRRRKFALCQANVANNFEGGVCKLLLSTEEPARFRMMMGESGRLVVWNFSSKGAECDLFAVVNVGSGGGLLDGKLCTVDNAQNFYSYRFKEDSCDIKDLIRDVPKLCSAAGKIVFSGACFLSVMDDVRKIKVVCGKSEGNSAGAETKQLIVRSLPTVFAFSANVPVSVCEVKDKAKWITDYVPFQNGKVVGRWNGSIGKCVYGVWEERGGRWKCVRSDEYDDMKWNAYTMGCYHFGDRIKTILLAIELER